ncbi:MAG: ShlB/FhaC/HecB family hemolysin secretion/activation protein [Woeseia sp.]
MAKFAITLSAAVLAPAQAAVVPLLDAVIIQQSTAYDQTELFETYKAYLGEPATESTAAAIAEALQQKYRLAGYSRPGYFITDRGTSSGIVRIKLRQASVSRVEMNGSAGPYRKELENLASSLPSPLSMRPEEIRSLLRQARRLPGLKIEVAAKPDEERSGAFIIALESDWKPVEGSIKLSNRGTEAIGRNLVFGRLVANGLFGGENASGLFFTSAENSDNYIGGGLFTNSALGDRGTSAQLQATVTSLQFETQGIEVQQRRERWSAKVRHVMQRESASEAGFWGGLTLEDLDVSYNEAVAREERLRSVQLGLFRSMRGNSSQSLVSAELEQGINGLGGRFDNFARSGDRTEHVFTILSLNYVRVWRLSELWTWRWDAVGHMSPDVLPSIKRFKVGGGRIGRGFEAAAVRGDNGIGNKLELKRRLGRDSGWMARTDLYGFYDVGTAWRNDGGDRQSASSAGLGFSKKGDWLSGYLEIAKPVTHADAEGRRDASIFAELTARF